MDGLLFIKCLNLKKKKCKLVFQNAFVFSVWKNHLREIIYFMLCVLKWEAENTDLLRSWGLERVGTEEEETIPSKKNSEEFCASLTTETIAVGTHRKMHSRA